MLHCRKYKMLKRSNAYYNDTLWVDQYLPRRWSAYQREAVKFLLNEHRPSDDGHMQHRRYASYFSLQSACSQGEGPSPGALSPGLNYHESRWLLFTRCWQLLPVSQIMSPDCCCCCHRCPEGHSLVPGHPAPPLKASDGGWDESRRGRNTELVVAKCSNRTSAWSQQLFQPRDAAYLWGLK